MSAAEARFVARPSAPRLILLLIVCCVFVAGGTWIAGLLGSAPRPGKEWVGWLSIIFFGLAAVAAVIRLFDRNDQIIVDDHGIYWRRWSEQTIPWSEIRDVREREAGFNRFLSLHLLQPDRFPSSRLLGRLAGVNRGMGYGDIAISTVGTNRSFDELKDAVLPRWTGGQSA